MSLAYSPEAKIDLLRRISELNSGTRVREGVARVHDILRGELERLGFVCRAIPNPLGAERSAPLLVGEKRGHDKRFINFVSHADTLEEPASTARRHRLSSDGTRAIGQGVLDDKAGQVIALAGIAGFLATQAQPRLSLRFVSSPSEEAGSSGFHEEFRRLSKDAVMALGFEPSLEDGSIIESRRGNRWYQIVVEGVEAHSGRAHKSGVNAAHELALKIARLHKLTDYKRDVTLSVGHIRGGREIYNVVCGRAEAKLDLRFSRLSDRDRVHRVIEKILKQSYVTSAVGRKRARTSYSIDDDCPSFSATPQSRPFIREYLRAASQLEGRRVKAAHSGGAADCSHMSRPGLIVIDGLGGRGGGMHSAEEFVELTSLETRSQALARLLAFADLKPPGAG